MRKEKKLLYLIIFGEFYGDRDIKMAHSWYFDKNGFYTLLAFFKSNTVGNIFK